MQPKLPAPNLGVRQVVVCRHFNASAVADPTRYLWTSADNQRPWGVGFGKAVAQAFMVDLRGYVAPVVNQDM